MATERACDRQVKLTDFDVIVPCEGDWKSSSKLHQWSHITGLLDSLDIEFNYDLGCPYGQALLNAIEIDHKSPHIINILFK